VALEPTEEQDYFDPKMDSILWRTSTDVFVVNVAQVIPPASSLFFHFVFGTLPNYVEIYK
jgi:hypothetical protein